MGGDKDLLHTQGEFGRAELMTNTSGDESVLFEAHSNKLSLESTADRVTEHQQLNLMDDTEVFSLHYSPDGNLMAAGCSDGSIRVFTRKGHLAYKLNSGPKSGLPTTCVRFRPIQKHVDSTKNVLIATNADGSVQHFHVTSQRRIDRIEEPNNEVYTVDYRPDGEMFATSGRDFKVRIYEEMTNTLITTMSLVNTKHSPGHASRVYCVKFKKDEPNILVSGGWDNTVQIWDIRCAKSVRSIFGAHIAGDAIDINGDGVLLTGSWRSERALQTWDLGTGRLLEDIYWHSSPMIYTARFSPDGSLVAAGGTGSNEARIFESNFTHKSLGRLQLPMRSGVYSLAFSPDGNKMVVGGSSNIVKEFNVLNAVK